MSKRRKGAFKEGIATVGMITSALISPLGGTSHSMTNSEHGQRNNYARDLATDGLHIPAMTLTDRS